MAFLGNTESQFAENIEGRSYVVTCAQHPWVTKPELEPRSSDSKSQAFYTEICPFQSHSSRLRKDPAPCLHNESFRASLLAGTRAHARTHTHTHTQPQLNFLPAAPLAPWTCWWKEFLSGSDPTWLHPCWVEGPRATRNQSWGVLMLRTDGGKEWQETASIIPDNSRS